MNPYSQTVGALTASVRLLGAYDGQNQLQGFITPGYILDRTSRNYRKAYELLASADPDRVTTYSTYAVGQVGDSVGDSAPAESGSYVPYPSDCYRLRAVEVLSGDRWLRLTREDPSPLDSPWDLPAGMLGDVAGRYRSEGQRVYLSPSVASGQRLKFTYVPAPAALTGSDQVVDCTAGADELAVWMTVRDLKVREERSTAEADEQIAAERKRIAAMARDRDSGQAKALEDPLAGGRWRRRSR